MEYVLLDEHTGFVGRGGETVTIDPGLYRVDVAGERTTPAPIADDGTTTLVEGRARKVTRSSSMRRWRSHLKWRRATDGSRCCCPAAWRRRQALRCTPAADVSRQQLFGSPGFASAVLLKVAAGIVAEACVTCT